MSRDDFDKDEHGLSICDYDEIRRWYEDEIASNEREAEDLARQVAALPKPRHLRHDRRYITALAGAEEASAGLWREHRHDDGGTGVWFDFDRLQTALGLVRAAVHLFQRRLTAAKVAFAKCEADTASATAPHLVRPDGDHGSPGQLVAASPRHCNAPPRQVDAPRSADALVMAAYRPPQTHSGSAGRRSLPPFRGGRELRVSNGVRRC